MFRITTVVFLFATISQVFSTEKEYEFIENDLYRTTKQRVRELAQKKSILREENKADVSHQVPGFLIHDSNSVELCFPKIEKFNLFNFYKILEKPTKVILDTHISNDLSTLISELVRDEHTEVNVTVASVDSESPMFKALSESDLRGYLLIQRSSCLIAAEMGVDAIENLGYVTPPSRIPVRTKVKHDCTPILIENQKLRINLENCEDLHLAQKQRTVSSEGSNATDSEDGEVSYINQSAHVSRVSSLLPEASFHNNMQNIRRALQVRIAQIKS